VVHVRSSNFDPEGGPIEMKSDSIDSIVLLDCLDHLLCPKIIIEKVFQVLARIIHERQDRIAANNCDCV